MQGREYVYIQSYKHDRNPHRIWAEGYVIEANGRRIITVINKTLVSGSDGRRWVTRELATYFFYPDKWYNVIYTVRKSGIHYYYNLASPSLYDREVIKNIDYDLDVKVSPTRETTLLDEDKCQEHSAEMGYSQKLDRTIHHGLNCLMVDIRLQNSSFKHREVLALYDKCLRYMDEGKRIK